MSDLIPITSLTQAEKLFSTLRNEACLQFDKGKILYIDVIYEELGAISAQQRKALHKWFRMCCDIFAERGETHAYCHPISKLIVEVPWTPSLFKEYIYKPTLFRTFNVSSTENQSTEMINTCVEAISMAYANHLGITLPFFPSIETMGSSLSIGSIN